MALDRPRPPRRTLVLLVTPIVVLSVVGTVTNALTPTLLAEHPQLLITLEARNRNLLLAASRVDAVPFVMIAVLRRLFSDPLYFLLGHYYGDGAVRWIEHKLGEGGSVVRVIERGFRRASKVMVFMFPGALVCVLAGATEMKVRTFVALNLAGTVAAVIVLRIFARALDGPVGAVQRFTDRNFRWLTLVTIGATLLWVVMQRKSGTSDVETLGEIEREIEGE